MDFPESGEKRSGSELENVAKRLQAEPNESVPYQVGEWLPSDEQHLRKYVADIKQRSKAKRHEEVSVTHLQHLWHPVIKAFGHMIESDPIIFEYLNVNQYVLS